MRLLIRKIKSKPHERPDGQTCTADESRRPTAKDRKKLIVFVTTGRESAILRPNFDA